MLAPVMDLAATKKYALATTTGAWEAALEETALIVSALSSSLGLTSPTLMVTNINTPNAPTRVFATAPLVNVSAFPDTLAKVVAVKFAQMTVPAMELAST